MLNRKEIERLAEMANALRPDWPIRSLVTLISTDLSGKAFQDVAVALAWIGSDPGTVNPGRIREAGPWWTATRPTGASGPHSVPGPSEPRCSTHPWELAHPCRACLSEAKAIDSPDTPEATTAPDPDRLAIYARGARTVRAALGRSAT